jgi:hypothetical protein
MAKQSKEQIEKKLKHHKKRVKFYKDKLEEINKEEKKIGFKFY